MTKSLIILALVALPVLTLWFVARTAGNLRLAFERQLQSEQTADRTQSQPMITAESIVSLPAPVQRFLHKNGTVGRRRVTSILATYDMEIFAKPGSAGMAGQAQQYDRLDSPKRLFFMETAMRGLPVAVLHDYQGTGARMQVRIASLVNVVNIAGRPDLARTETVTLLNDLCMFAPSWLTDRRLQWRPIDDHSATVTFTNGPHTVNATLLFDDQDQLVNFVSEDRGALQDDGTLKIMRWSTPMRSAQSFDGRLYPTEGEAVWHYPEGAFTYGKMKNAKVEAIE